MKETRQTQSKAVKFMDLQTENGIILNPEHISCIVEREQGYCAVHLISGKEIVLDVTFKHLRACIQEYTVHMEEL